MVAHVCDFEWKGDDEHVDIFSWILKEELKPGSNYIFKVNNRNTKTRCEICSIKDNNENTKTMPMALLWCLYC